MLGLRYNKCSINYYYYQKCYFIWLNPPHLPSGGKSHNHKSSEICCSLLRTILYARALHKLFPLFFIPACCSQMNILRLRRVK
jgi:hypothetical protein